LSNKLQNDTKNGILSVNRKTLACLCLKYAINCDTISVSLLILDYLLAKVHFYWIIVDFPQSRFETHRQNLLIFPDFSLASFH